MKCPHCGSEWNIAAGMEQTVTECPFCRQSLAPKAAENATLESVLRTIRETYGAEQMKNGKVMLSYFRDIAPKLKKEQRMLENFVSAGGPEALFAVAGSPAGEQQVALTRVRQRLEDDMLMASDLAAAVCDAFLLAMGDEKQAQPDFEIDEYGVLVKYHGKEAHVRVPDGVREIGEKAFYENIYIRTLDLPDGLEIIGKFAFQKTYSLTEVHFPSSLRRIEEEAFSHCGLKTMNLPAGLQLIGQNAFDACYLSSLDLRLDSAVVEEGAFSFSQLETLTISGDAAFGKGVFSFNTHLKEVILLPGVREIPDNAFSSCSALETVVLPDTLTRIGDAAFLHCSALRQIRLPSGLTRLGKFALSNCDALEEVTIPGSVRTVESHTFSNCNSLKQVTLEPGVQKLHGGAFFMCKALERILVPASLKKIDDPNIFMWCKKPVEMVLTQPKEDPGAKRFENVNNVYVKKTGFWSWFQ